MRKGDIIELKIDRIAYGGQGVARLDGFVIFVRGAAPGDLVSAVLMKKKRDYAEARIIEVVDSSPDRVNAPCPYFGCCGGCQWQHVHYSRQLEYKKRLIEEAMTRIGGISGAIIRDPIASEKIFGYRNKMEFSFSDRPWIACGPHSIFHTSPVMAGEPALGLHVPGSFSKVLDIEACLLQEERGNEILQTVKRFARESDLPPYNLKTHQGFWRFLTLRRSVSQNTWMVNVVTSEYRKETVENLGKLLTSTFHDIKTIVNNVTSKRAAIAVGEWQSIVAGTGIIEDRIGPYTFQISANSFFQTSTPGAATLYNIVLEYAELTGSESVLDLYSGTGTIPIFVSPRSMRVVGMEISERAVEDAQNNCRANGIENCRFVLGDIRARLSSLTFKPDVLIVDPPRAGMHKDVVSKILNLGTSKIVYVSCNPATMARDLSEMKDYYDVVEIQPVDLFPHTYHIESIAKLVRKN